MLTFDHLKFVAGGWGGGASSLLSPFVLENTSIEEHRFSNALLFASGGFTAA